MKTTSDISLTLTFHSCFSVFCSPLCKNCKRCQKCEIYAVFTVVTTNNMRTRKQLWTMSNGHLIDINISQLRFCFRPPCLVPLSGKCHQSANTSHLSPISYLKPHTFHPSHTTYLIAKTYICHPSAYLIFCRRLCPGRKLMWRQF